MRARHGARHFDQLRARKRTKFRLKQLNKRYGKGVWFNCLHVLKDTPPSLGHFQCFLALLSPKGSLKPLGETGCWVPVGWIHTPPGRVPLRDWDIAGLNPVPLESRETPGWASQPKRAQENPSPKALVCAESSLPAVCSHVEAWFKSEPGSHPLLPCRTL